MTNRTERIDDARARHRREASQRGINPRDVDILLADLTGWSLPHLLAHGDERIEAGNLDRLLARRYAGEPLQYIRGKADFFTREFFVDDRVLIPRPETEFVVEAAVERAPRGGRVIDIGTGSGCIAISIERERPDLRVTGADLSVAALAVAAMNRKRLQSRISLVASDVLGSIESKFDLIVSNPPYIPKRDIPTLQTEVRDYEPHLALTPGPYGTEIIERILDQARPLLGAEGRVILEIGFGQEADLRAVAAARGFEVETVVPDLAAIPRVIVLSAHA
jgi:release factor glutamine methyltransferase